MRSEAPGRAANWRMTVAEWIRRTLRSAGRRQPLRAVSKKINVVRAAARHSYPVGDIEQMLAEIEQGYVGV